MYLNIKLCISVYFSRKLYLFE
uniref:Uncharacterized protein n=1 Tax=Anguilla anguilla TaxID=7936 RepID=A0A0E9R8U3_ANGAN